MAQKVSSPTIIVERAGSYAWTHRSWRVREEFARTVTSAIGLFLATELPLQHAILSPILQMLSDQNPGVQEVAISCIEEMYVQAGPQFLEELQRHHLPTSMEKWKPIHTFAQSGQIDFMDALLERGYDIELMNKDGLTALHQAVIGKKESVISHLLRKGANPEARDLDGATPLH